MGSSQSSPKKVTFERKGDDAIEVTQEAFDQMTGKKTASSSAESKQESNSSSKSRSNNNNKSLHLADDINHAELMALEERFQEKLRHLEAAQKRDFEAEKATLESHVKELEKKLSHSVVAIDGVCRASQDDVIACYKSNPKQSLNCAKAIEQFSHCVNNERLRLLGATANNSPSAGASSS